MVWRGKAGEDFFKNKFNKGDNMEPTTDATIQEAAQAAIPTPTHDEIAVRAYENWLDSGGIEGTADADWKEAEISLWIAYVHAVDACVSSPA
jgi:Protein of unknown function (DUF2934)